MANHFSFFSDFQEILTFIILYSSLLLTIILIIILTSFLDIFNMPLLIIILSALIGLFSFSSFATFREINKKKRQKKVPQFVEQWKKIKNNLEK